MKRKIFLLVVVLSFIFSAGIVSAADTYHPNVPAGSTDNSSSFSAGSLENREGQAQLVVDKANAVEALAKTSQAQITTRKYSIGVGSNEANPVFDAASSAAHLAEISDIAYIQRTWDPSGNNGKSFYDAVKDDVLEARKKGLKVYISMEIMDPYRKTFRVPAGFSKSFADKRTQKAYIDMVHRVARDFHPEYFILNVEANAMRAYDEKAYQDYVKIFPLAWLNVKLVSPATKAATSLILTDFNNRDGLDAQDLSILKRDAADFKVSDLLGVSVYPFSYFDPRMIPDDLMGKIAAVSSKPLFISETGWVSESFKLTSSYTFQSSQEAQALYVWKLASMASYAEKAGYKVEAINYISLVDPSDEVQKYINQYFPDLSWYNSLALMDKNGNAKSAYNVLKYLKTALPLTVRTLDRNTWPLLELSAQYPRLPTNCGADKGASWIFNPSFAVDNCK